MVEINSEKVVFLDTHFFYTLIEGKKKANLSLLRGLGGP
jgi:hypothetical protein